MNLDLEFRKIRFINENLIEHNYQIALQRVKVQTLISLEKVSPELNFVQRVKLDLQTLNEVIKLNELIFNKQKYETEFSTFPAANYRPHYV